MITNGCSGNVTVADGSSKKFLGVGRLELRPSVTCEYNSDIIDHVLHVPELNDNLLSVSKLDENNLMIIIVPS